MNQPTGDWFNRALDQAVERACSQTSGTGIPVPVTPSEQTGGGERESSGYTDARSTQPAEPATPEQWPSGPSSGPVSFGPTPELPGNMVNSLQYSPVNTSSSPQVGQGCPQGCQGCPQGCQSCPQSVSSSTQGGNVVGSLGAPPPPMGPVPLGMMCPVPAHMAAALLEQTGLSKGQGKGVPTMAPGCGSSVPCGSQPLPNLGPHPCNLGASGCPGPTGPTGQCNMSACGGQCFPGQGCGSLPMGCGVPCGGNFTPSVPAMDPAMMLCVQMMQQMQQHNQYMIGAMQQQQAQMQQQQNQFLSFLERMEERRAEQAVPNAFGSPEVGSGPPGLTPQAPASSASASVPVFKAIDSKVLPSMPTVDASKWASRPAEILGFHSFVDTLTGWVGMMSPEFGQEIRKAMATKVALRTSEMTKDQVERSSRLYYLLKQALEKSSRVASLIKLVETALGYPGGTDTNGYLLLQKIRDEFSLRTRTEALHFRQTLLSFRVKSTTNLKDLINLLEAEWVSLNKIFSTALDPSVVADCLPTEPDRYRWLLQNLPSECKRYVQLHAADETYDAAVKAILVYYEKTVLTDQDLGKASTYSLSAFNVDAFGGSDDDRKSEKQKETRECWYCKKKGHLAKDCRQKKKDEKEGKLTPRSEGKKGGKSSGKNASSTGKGSNSSTGKAKGSPKAKAKGRGKGGKKGARAAEYTGEEGDEGYEGYEGEEEEYEGPGADESEWSEVGDEEEPIRLAPFLFSSTSNPGCPAESCERVWHPRDSSFVFRNHLLGNQRTTCRQHSHRAFEPVCSNGPCLGPQPLNEPNAESDLSKSAVQSSVACVTSVAEFEFESFETVMSNSEQFCWKLSSAQTAGDSFSSEPVLDEKFSSQRISSERFVHGGVVSSDPVLQNEVSELSSQDLFCSFDVFLEHVPEHVVGNIMDATSFLILDAPVFPPLPSRLCEVSEVGTHEMFDYHEEPLNSLKQVLMNEDPICNKDSIWNEDPIWNADPIYRFATFPFFPTEFFEISAGDECERCSCGFICPVDSGFDLTLMFEALDHVNSGVNRCDLFNPFSEALFRNHASCENFHSDQQFSRDSPSCGLNAIAQPCCELERCKETAPRDREDRLMRYSLNRDVPCTNSSGGVGDVSISVGVRPSACLAAESERCDSKQSPLGNLTISSAVALESSPEAVPLMYSSSIFSSSRLSDPTCQSVAVMCEAVSSSCFQPCFFPCSCALKAEFCVNVTDASVAACHSSDEITHSTEVVVREDTLDQRAADSVMCGEVPILRSESVEIVNPNDQSTSLASTLQDVRAEECTKQEDSSEEFTSQKMIHVGVDIGSTETLSVEPPLQSCLVLHSQSMPSSVCFVEMPEGDTSRPSKRADLCEKQSMCSESFIHEDVQESIAAYLDTYASCSSEPSTADVIQNIATSEELFTNQSKSEALSNELSRGLHSGSKKTRPFVDHGCAPPVGVSSPSSARLKRVIKECIYSEIPEVERLFIQEDPCLKAFFKSNLEVDELNLREWWLLDSGASRSVVSEKYLDGYEIQRERQISPPLTFSTASGEQVAISREVVIKMHLVTEFGSTKSLLMRCLVSKVEHNLISVFGVTRQGWTFRMSPEVCEITFQDVRMHPVIWSNCPWLKAVSQKQAVKPSPRGKESYSKGNGKSRGKSPTRYQPSQSSSDDMQVDAITLESSNENELLKELKGASVPRKVFFKNGLIT